MSSRVESMHWPFIMGRSNMFENSALLPKGEKRMGGSRDQKKGDTLKGDFLFLSVLRLSATFFHDSLKFEFFGTYFGKLYQVLTPATSDIQTNEHLNIVHGVVESEPNVLNLVEYRTAKRLRGRPRKNPINDQISQFSKKITTMYRISNVQFFYFKRVFNLDSVEFGILKFRIKKIRSKKT
ncbi:hypothetical protein BpHYR1_018358 [Brachionus plicatilis]|uniref:Uncharacterized protein n=1 Tax=Brachionus plicatilis TaxID=10195 RepID=A0A3M7PB87_BRAPC|nr:hypothetical protein BpHYR1_018358 [Brachionus plicatilis]